MKLFHQPRLLLLLLGWLLFHTAVGYPTSEEGPYVEYGDLKYRRVCIAVYQSTLCMIVRFPFDVPLQVQDDSITYPYPVDDRFYELTKPAFMIDGPELDQCRVELLDHPIEARIQRCLERVGARRPEQVVVVFTRQSSPDQEEVFYGTKSKKQQKRLYEFFHDHDIMVVGDSMAPSTSRALAELFKPCSLPHQQSLDGHNLYRMHDCGQQQQQALERSFTAKLQRRLGLSSSSSSSSSQYQLTNFSSTIRVGNLWFRPDIYFDEVNHHHWHVVNGTKPFMDEFRSKSFMLRGRPQNSGSHGSAPLRPLAIIVAYPFAHIQNQYMIHDSLAQVMYNQQRFVEMLMNITSPTVRSEMTELGFDLRHMMVFDGYPQHFPTGTSAYAENPHSNERDFLAGHGYPGWQPSLGSSCRGPLPRNSILTSINHQERHYFEQHDFDMRWYGKTWEFTNQFWWGLAMWGNGGGTLDCTHPGPHGSGLSRVIKYFLQAMIDGYYEAANTL